MKTIYAYLLTILFIGGVASSQEVTYLDRLKIKNAGGTEVFSVKFYQDKIKIEFADKTLDADIAPKKGKRKYELKDSDVAEILYAENGFKLRDTKGKLLWKVKLSADQISIANNEAMESPWRIVKSGEKLKVSNNKRLIAEVRWYPENKKLKLKNPAGKELFVAKADGLFGNSPACT